MNRASSFHIAFLVTNKIYDTANALVETDVTTYSLSSSNVLAFTSGDVQSSSGTLTVTAQ